MKELRRGARGVAVGVVEAEEAADVRRLELLMGEATVRAKAFLGDKTEIKIEFLTNFSILGP